MSNENVAIVRQAYAAQAGGERVERFFDPDVEWHQASDLPDAGVQRGVAAVVAMLGEWEDSFEGFHAEVQSYEAHGDRVLVQLVLRGRIRGTEDGLALGETHVWRLREGRVIEVREYRSRDEALRTLG